MKLICLLILSMTFLSSFSSGFLVGHYSLNRKKGQQVAEALVLYGYTSAKQGKSLADTLTSVKDFIPSN